MLAICIDNDCAPIMDVDKEIDRLNYTSEYTCSVAGFMLNFLHSKQVKPPAWAEYRCFQKENNRI